jgi:hypothetical protein
VKLDKKYNVRPETLKWLEENTGQILQDMVISNDFENKISKRQQKQK